MAGITVTTPNDLYQLALTDAGVIGQGQSASGQDIADTHNRCNMMLAQWNRKRWLIYRLVDTAFTSTGAQSYTVGAGGNFNIARPDRLEFAFFRQIIPSATVSQIDYPLELIEARETYSLIMLKQLQTFPQYAFYDADFPLGNVFPWPVIPASIYSLHIGTKAVISAFTSLTQQISLPPEYFAAILHNLSARLQVAYKLPLDPGIIALAKDSLNVIRGANTQIPRLQMPKGVLRPGHYNIWSDRVT